MKCPYTGTRGSFFVTHKTTGEKLLRIWQDQFVGKDGVIYFDDDFSTRASNKKDISARENLMLTRKAVVARSKRDEYGNIIRPREHLDYVGLISIKDIAVDERGLMFEVAAYLERYK